MRLFFVAICFGLLSTPACAASVTYFQSVAAGDTVGLPVVYSGPAAGESQTFRLTWNGLELSSDLLNEFAYQQDRILPNGSNDAYTILRSCVTGPTRFDPCHFDYGSSEFYPQAHFRQSSSLNGIVFTITNPARIFDPLCADQNSCVREWGFSEGRGSFQGIFQAGPEGGTLELIALDPTPIPEPSIWALVILGVGLVGLRLRARPSAIREG